MLRALVANRAARRLALLVVWLAIADAFVPRVLAPLERSRYESDTLFRFEGSDLFGLGPVVAYLRDVPRGPRPRTVFLGSSVIFGYGLATPDTIPAAFQRLEPGRQVINLAVNNLHTPSSYLIAKQIVGSVDTLYVLVQGNYALPNLAHLIAVAPDDRHRFGVADPSTLEQWLRRRLSFWRLYSDSYRLQNAAFGGSTRMYVYQNKAVWARAAIRTVRGTPAAAVQPFAAVTESPTRIDIVHRVAPRVASARRLQALSVRHRVLWDFATLATSQQRRLILLDFVVRSPRVTYQDAADFNARFGPRVAVVQVMIPRELLLDSQHLTAAGSTAVATALAAWQREAEAAR
jgi:hypothetical protein